MGPCVCLQIYSRLWTPPWLDADAVVCPHTPDSDSDYWFAAHSKGISPPTSLHAHTSLSPPQSCQSWGHPDDHRPESLMRVLVRLLPQSSRNDSEIGCRSPVSAWTKLVGAACLYVPPSVGAVPVRGHAHTGRHRHGGVWGWTGHGSVWVLLEQQHHFCLEWAQPGPWGHPGLYLPYFLSVINYMPIFTLFDHNNSIGADTVVYIADAKQNEPAQLN